MHEYRHNGHKALVTVKKWLPGDHLLAGDVVWPDARPSDVFSCGRCGQRLAPRSEWFDGETGLQNTQLHEADR